MRTEDIMAVKQSAVIAKSQSELVVQMAEELDLLQKESLSMVRYTIGAPVRLADLPKGALFGYRGTIALKTEYRSGVSGAIEAYIVGSGERFWGGSYDAESLNNLSVTPWIFKPTL